jgi:signal-transduction protein with cAMP-binding, CBS, and nucleotidyltransferase domain
LSAEIIATHDPAVNQRAQNVLNTVLPLFGTWVGPVLAYYFARDNFETATSSTQKLVHDLTPEERLRSTRVADVMTKNISSHSDLSAKVGDVLEQVRKKDVKRLPILQPSGVLEALLYLEDLMSYLFGMSDPDRSNKTIGDLLKEKPDLKHPPAYVSESATLAQAKDAMERLDKCKVVVVTKSGNPSEPVLGMLTNTDFAKYSRA